MRLIDADALLKEIEESANAVEIQIHLGKCDENVAKGMLSGLALVRENILRKPTAYDTEKVVAELEEYKYSHLVEHDSERYEHCKEEEKNCDGRDCFLCVWDKAILIVRKGGA